MNNRANIIRELVKTRTIRSQEEFIGLLAEKGLQTTQSTLSRDLKRMGISKRHDPEKGYCYVLPEQVRPVQGRLHPEKLVSESIVSIEFSGQMGVIKTLPGCADMVGALIDEHVHPALMGTVAGENTLLLALREAAPHGSILAFLEKIVPGIGNLLIHKNEETL